MKAVHNSFFLVTLALIALGCSVLEDDMPDTLPEATQKGANTFGAVIDGEVFLPHEQWLATPPAEEALNAVYGDDFRNDLVIRAARTARKTSDTYVTLSYIVNDTIACPEAVCEELFDFFLVNVYRVEEDGAREYFGDADSPNSFMTLTHFDTTTQIASGVFAADVTDLNGKTLEIREGRFDVIFSKAD